MLYTLSSSLQHADSRVLAGYVHTPRPMGVNEKPATYPPTTKEKQGRSTDDTQRQYDDVEAGDGRQNENEGDDQMDELEGGLGEHAFHHPALYAPQVSE